MKKLILRIILFVSFLFVFPSSIYAAPGIDCWQVHMNDQIAVCSKASTQCILSCPSQDLKANVVCLNNCGKIDNDCNKTASADYDVCIEAQKQPQPTKTPAPTASQSSTDYILRCWNTYMIEEMATCSPPQDKCIRECVKLESGFNACDAACNVVFNACLKHASADYHVCDDAGRLAAQKKPEIKQQPLETLPSSATGEQPKKPSVGISSRDFRALAQANAEYQEAQANLEEIKKNKDPRWADNSNFANDYNSQPQTQPNTASTALDIVQKGLEQTVDGSSVYLDIKDIYDQYVKGEVATYTGVSLITDVANGVIKFTDLTNKGVSAIDATSKTVIDTIGTGSLYLLPPVKLADMAATMPDRILNTFGFSENSAPRKVTGFLKDNSPSAFIELSTDAMIVTGNWTNLGGAVSTAWDDLKSAQGFGGKAQATLDLVGTAVGAVPVAIAMQLRDEVSTLFTVVKFGASGAGNIVSNWFTYPN